ncbi:MAG: type II toxin-antitoxin system VapC family toxin [Kiritimatiellia bacterium]
MILDTNAVSDLLSGNPDLETLLVHSEKHHLPVIVIGEYRFGLMASRKREVLEPLLDRLEEESFILSPDRNTARHYASIRHELKRKAKPIPENDIWIAALARQHQLEVASNDEHFDQVESIDRITW